MPWYRLNLSAAMAASKPAAAPASAAAVHTDISVCVKAAAIFKTNHL
jgi:hypothetical protein